MSADEVLFTQDFGVLFAMGNWRKFSFEDSIQSGNTMARIAIYVALALALFKSEPKYLALGLLGLIASGFIYGDANITLPLNEQNTGTYYGNRKYKAGAVTTVHDRELGASKETDREILRNTVLSNVRELNHYMGGAYASPTGEEYMLGGTRPGSSNMTEELRNNDFFKNNNLAAHNGVTYSNIIPVSEF